MALQAVILSHNESWSIHISRVHLVTQERGLNRKSSIATCGRGLRAEIWVVASKEKTPRLWRGLEVEMSGLEPLSEKFEDK